MKAALVRLRHTLPHTLIQAKMSRSVLVFFGLLALALGAQADSYEFSLVEAAADMSMADGEDPFYAVAHLDGANQVPEPIDINTTAVFQIVIGKTYASWVLGVEGIDEMTMAHIHYGNATTNGLPIVLLTPYAPVSDLEAMDLPMYTPPLSGLIVAKNTFNASDIANAPSITSLQSLQDEISAGNVYVNVHSVHAPAGLIRAQLAYQSPQEI